MYKDDNAVARDEDLRGWSRRLTSTDADGGRLKGLTRDGSALNTRGELAEVLRAVLVAVMRHSVTRSSYFQRAASLMHMCPTNLVSAELPELNSTVSEEQVLQMFGGTRQLWRHLRHAGTLASPVHTHLFTMLPLTAGVEDVARLRGVPPPACQETGGQPLSAAFATDNATAAPGGATTTRRMLGVQGVDAASARRLLSHFSQIDQTEPTSLAGDVDCGVVRKDFTHVVWEDVSEDNTAATGRQFRDESDSSPLTTLVRNFLLGVMDATLTGEAREHNVLEQMERSPGM